MLEIKLSFNPSNRDDEINAEINVTPLIDIMLVLLIVFMVTSSVSLESGLDINLPEAASTAKSETPAAVILSLGADGTISVAGNVVAIEQVEEAVRLALSNEKTTLVILEGDRAADLGSAVKVMDIAKLAGAKQFAIAAESSSN